MTPTLRTFQVLPDIPPALQPLVELGRNLWWCWNEDAADLFRRLDRALWDETNHSPTKLLALLKQDQLDEAAGDAGYLAQLKRVHAHFKEQLAEKAWFNRAHPKRDDLLVGYFSAEFGLHESLPIYSGGLGVLAGDHLKSASDLGVPLVAVGLFYRNGYFQQYLSTDGWQQEAYPELDFFSLPAEPQHFADGSPMTVKVDLPDSAVHARVWKVSVGRVPLYLLDTNVPENSPADRDITSRLYGGGTEMRIRQEIVLGIGGVRALDALGIKPTVFHMNEGHSAFLALERVRKGLHERPDLRFDEVRQAVMAGCVFTTHTPVPAGIDMFPPDLVMKYLRPMVPALKLDEEGFLALGREDVGNAKQGFSMAVLALRLADGCNGVSKLHGEVSRGMWQGMWPGLPAAEVPIGHVTNGIHARTWMSGEMVDLLERYLGDSFVRDPADAGAWADVETIPDEELWRAHERSREKLVVWTRGRVRAQRAARGASYDEVSAAEELLDPDALTVGFARRFATYKRGALLLRDKERLVKLLSDNARPIQFVFAGKAHPADHGGKELIRAIVNFARDAGVRRRFTFIENYDMGVARNMVQGVDVWLNTPRRPHEASGTSGMKAAVNGVLNLSVLDGWWVEGYEPDVGWAIGRGENYADPELQDELESKSLYDTLERQVVPLFYDRGADGVPRHWVRRMKACLRKLGPAFNTNRMVAQYATDLYLPAAARAKALAAEDQKRGLALSHDKDRLRHSWRDVRVVGVTATSAATNGSGGYFKVGDQIRVEAIVDLARLAPRDVRVQLYSGPLSADGHPVDASTLAADLEPLRAVGPQQHLYAGALTCKAAGRHGYAVRVLPGLSDLATPFEPGMIVWG